MGMLNNQRVIWAVFLYVGMSPPVCFCSRAGYHFTAEKEKWCQQWKVTSAKNISVQCEPISKQHFRYFSTYKFSFDVFVVSFR